ncbi:hypothetical protein Back11_49300 [Paenibacillus baekrokdamisoli]|uniref:Uncharacterized protein n=1 Tax=Paenibacillus baekrokdamisoli TaxID=1712516 RepID=A0A3G9J5E2_9BACL|nr:HAD family hydrolase [Paenibacillus baekrokdamisoli]MBB3068753.1 beta-phosphoglucomutase-like phosphatase (HAD superfamily) [Paenibacillus baekrokdamisoli]BBH23585.1 hypothetical protein Back11_49300 [Paenibacillus baekrokdamisoli]
MKCILFDLDGTIQDSEKLATEANRLGFRTILGREATTEELEQLVGKPIAKFTRLYFRHPPIFLGFHLWRLKYGFPLKYGHHSTSNNDYGHCSNCMDY